MLERVQIENFRCLKNMEVPLKPLTVLVGPNDSGKSAFLAALHALTGTRLGENGERLPWQPGDTIREWDVWRNTTGSITAGVVGSTATSSISASSASSDIQLHGKGPNPIEPTVLYVLPSVGVRMESEGPPDDRRAPTIRWNGEGVPAYIDYLVRQDRVRFSRVEKALKELIPGFQELSIVATASNMRRIDLVIDEGLRIPGGRTSVGVRLIIFFVALSYHPDPPKLILLEEPENGVHPKRLAEIVRLLREITEGKHGDHPAQVVLTTHSPHLLDCIDVEKDQVLVFSRNEDGSRSAEPVDEERLKIFLDEFLLGEVWDNEGEAGLVRRKP